MDVLNTHLPKILDLAGNFDIDLSEILSGYVEKIKEDVPGFSFPEAALLIQQWSEIYGRKVDYVHALALGLSANLNSRAYGSKTQAEDEEQPNIPRRIVKSRKSKTGESMTTEDFQLVTMQLDKPKVLNDSGRKKRRKKKHCREAVCIELVNLNFQHGCEYHIYEDEQYASIGRKDQFRINWPIQPNCRMAENLVDSCPLNSGAVANGGIINMPDLEYINDDDNDVGGDVESIVDPPEEVVPATETLPLSGAPQNAIPELEIEQVLGSKFDLVGADEADKIVNKPLFKKSTFKLPYELTKKGINAAKPELNFTLYLFSNLLKRALKMTPALPPILKEKNSDKKLTAKLISYIMKYYSADDRLEISRGLMGMQEDFLGFEPDNVPERAAIGALFDEHLNEDGSEEPAVEAPTAACEANPSSSPRDNNDDGWDGAGASADSAVEEDPRIERRKVTIDTADASEWRQKMQGVLARENGRRNFDVHEYGADIINTFQAVGEELPFSEIVGGLPEEEVSRYFLSSLMLVSTAKDVFYPAHCAAQFAQQSGAGSPSCPLIFQANTGNLLLTDNGEPNSLGMKLQQREQRHSLEDILVPPSARGKRTGTEGRPERYLKQKPGEGPWRNKSKRGKRV